MKKSKQLLLAMAVVSALSSTTAYGEELPAYDLEPTVVTATKSEEKLLNTSADVSVITGKDIQRMHYQNVKEALVSVPNVQFLSYNNMNNINKLLINGDHRVVVLLNGVRVSQLQGDPFKQSTFGFELDRDMDNIQRIEVLKGAASVLYGADAAGGVINIITKEHAKPETKVAVDTGAFGFGKEKVSTSGQVGKTDYSIEYAHTKRGDYKDAIGRTWPYHTRANNMTVMLNHRMTDKSNVVVNFNKQIENAYFWDILTQEDYDIDSSHYTFQTVYNQDLGKGFYNTLAYTKSNNKEHSYRTTPHNPSKNFGNDVPGFIDSSNPAKLSDSGKTKVKKENTAQDKGIVIGNREHFPNYQNSDINLVIINDTLTKRFDNRETLKIGYEYAKSTDQRSAKFWQKDIAYFLQNEWKFAPKWNLITGYRRDQFSHESHKYKPHKSSSLTISHEFDDKTNAYIAYNEYFLVPPITMRSGTKYSNPKLMPEIGNNREFGINHRINDKSMVNFHYFKRSSKNGIAFNDGSEKYINSPVRAHGFDINYIARFDEHWSANVGYAHLSMDEGKYRNYTKGYLASNILTTNVKYKNKKWDIGMVGRYFFGRLGNNRFADVGNVAWPSERYLVVDLGVNYQANERVKVYATINNLFNQDYATHTRVGWNEPSRDMSPLNRHNNWYTAPGRAINIGMEYKF